MKQNILIHINPNTGKTVEGAVTKDHIRYQCRDIATGHWLSNKKLNQVNKQLKRELKKRGVISTHATIGYDAYMRSLLREYCGVEIVGMWVSESNVLHWRKAYAEGNGVVMLK